MFKNIIYMVGNRACFQATDYDKITHGLYREIHYHAIRSETK